MVGNYIINDAKVFKIFVVATMSSGKSTFINALIGDDLLPSKNEACTVKPVFIINNNEENYKLFVNHNNENKVISKANATIIEKLNSEANVDSLYIEGRIQAVDNCDKQVVIVDTPGTNNSLDITHMNVTYELMEKVKAGLIVYLINATQFGINDDLKLLSHIATKVNNSNGKVNILIVVNKIDELDDEKECIETTINNVYKYVENIGIKNFSIIPISALAAKLFNSILMGKGLTRKEMKNFISYYELFNHKDYDVRKFSIIGSTQVENQYVAIGDNKYKKIDILMAMENTGITLVSGFIKEMVENK
ncbi:dynamin family protein [Clostridium tarantellae]|uniref:Dynamin N-terminal domain-containing protein n=1 Tax=Clostridium tarantellae TaxID=39493 RepID=A0A6I1MLD1_9CLOT|nr:dynamin family protein [Clostridium tarantellae]MPQ43553.1 hypothetical protein [Clostridium tarantellae]